MAILQSGNLELEFQFAKYYSQTNWSDYSFELRVCGQPLINPAVNAERFKDGKYTIWNTHEPDNIIVFFENILLKKESASWDLFPEDQIKIKAETNNQKKLTGKKAGKEKQ